MVATGIHPDDLKKVRAARAESLKPGCIQREVAYRLQDFRGIWHWLHDKWVVVRDGSGNPVYIMSISHDETKQKLIAKELTETQLIYRTFFESTGTAMMVVEEDRTASLVNAEFARMTGYGKSEMEGSRKWMALVSEEDRDRMQNYHEIRKSSPLLAPKSYEFSVKDKSGRARNLLAVVQLVPGTKRSVASIVDITELKEAEAALRESEERFRAIFDRSLDCIYISDLEGAFIDANPASLNLLGYDKEDIRSLNFTSLIDPDHIPLAVETLDELKQTGFQSGLKEFSLKCKDGGYVDVETAASVVYHDKKPHEIPGIARDITERKRPNGRNRIYFSLLFDTSVSFYL